MSTEIPLTDMHKLAHLLEHWQDHNGEHAANYRAWADKARDAGRLEAADLLLQAADATDKITQFFGRARKALD